MDDDRSVSRSTTPMTPRGKSNKGCVVGLTRTIHFNLGKGRDVFWDSIEKSNASLILGCRTLLGFWAYWTGDLERLESRRMRGEWKSRRRCRRSGGVPENRSGRGERRYRRGIYDRTKPGRLEFPVLTLQSPQEDPWKRLSSRECKGWGKGSKSQEEVWDMIGLWHKRGKHIR